MPNITDTGFAGVNEVRRTKINYNTSAPVDVVSQSLRLSTGVSVPLWKQVSFKNAVEMIFRIEKENNLINKAPAGNLIMAVDIDNQSRSNFRSGSTLNEVTATATDVIVQISQASRSNAVATGRRLQIREGFKILTDFAIEKWKDQIA